MKTTSLAGTVMSRSTKRHARAANDPTDPSTRMRPGVRGQGSVDRPGRLCPTAHGRHSPNLVVVFLRIATAVATAGLRPAAVIVRIIRRGVAGAVAATRRLLSVARAA